MAGPLLAPAPVSPAEQLAARLAVVAPERRAAVYDRVIAEHPDGPALVRSWRFWARPGQLAPGTEGAAVQRTGWRWWGLITGRGYGKTRSGAEFVVDRAEAFAAAGVSHRAGGLAPTAADARDTMVEGESGLIAVCERRGVRYLYEPSKRRFTTWHEAPDGRTILARVTLYSAERPDRPRGANMHTWWCEELAAWPLLVDAHGNTAFTNADLSLRLPCPPGLVPQGVVTTTPKPIPMVTDLIDRAGLEGSNVVLTRGALYENLRNLAPAFVQAILDRYEGTALGEQEVYGLLLDIVEGALWDPTVLNDYRVSLSRLPAAPGDGLDDDDVPAEAIVAYHQAVLAALGIDQVTVGVDPSGGGSAETGIVAVGLNRTESVAYTLEDATVDGPPEVWGPAVVDCYHRWFASKVVGETNYGGDMVRSTVHVVDSTVAFDKVTAKVGKQLRAQPISALTHRGRARHAGQFGRLEAQQVSWVPGDDSPDRLDAYVYAVTDLLGLMTSAPASAASPNRAGSARSGRSARWSPMSRTSGRPARVRGR